MQLALVIFGGLFAGTVTAGPVIVAGHDADDHGFVSVYAGIFDDIYAAVSNGQTGIVSIGTDGGNNSASNWIENVAAAMTVPQTVTHINGTSAIGSVDFCNFAIIAVPSDSSDTTGGISQAETTALAGRASDIANFINGGGGLFGQTGDSFTDAYGYLGIFASITPFGIPSNGVCDGGGGGGESWDDISTTAEGLLLGITDTNLDGCCFHNTFTSYAPFLKVLATATEPGCPSIDGEAAFIGCLDCSIPPQMQLAPVIDFNPPNTNHTVTATLLEDYSPYDPIVGETITFTVISGPNVGDTGMDVTDSFGDATFTYLGDGGIGVDTIQAMSLGGPGTCMNPGGGTITSNNVLKFWDLDCNNNGIPDTCDIDCMSFGMACSNYPGCGGSADVDLDGKPDDCAVCGDGIVEGGEECDDGNTNNGDCCSSTCTYESSATPCVADGDFCTADACDGAGNCVAGGSPCGGATPVCCEALDSCVAECCDDSDCNDGDFCNGVETCVAGSCQAGTAPDCDDGVACTVDSCDETNDICVHAPDNGFCDDGDFCNGVETCDAVNDCQAGSAPNCDDGVACTIDSCDETNDVCVNAPDNGFCDDGDFCNGVETCDAINDCQAGTAPDCDDGVGCTDDSCDEVNDVCVHAPNNGSCNDNLFCTGIETCDPINDCQPGTPVDCDDFIGCTIDTCDEAKDQCLNTPDNSLCDDGDFCNGAETCSEFDDCQPGTAPNCDDGVSCTVDSCDEANDTCVHAPDDAFCSDGDFCNGVETCDPVNDCQPGTAPNCDDAVSCTVDSCDDINDTCVHAPDNALCDDGAFCNGVETCDPVNDCQSGTAPDCNDGVGCTVDSCDEANDVCVNAPDDALCNDNQYCNGVEFCDPVNDCQAGTAPNCDDGVGCTDNSCDEANDVCVNTPNNANCDDGQFCNGAETCDPTNDCQAGTAPNCDDGVGCTNDSCDEANDTCVNTPDDGNCDDGQFCNGVETCDPTNDCQAGTAPNCDDGVGCTNDSCDEANDTCVNTPDNANCDDGQFCNGVETCDAINDCQAGTAPNCDDGVGCTDDSCDETNDTCVNAPNNGLCDDGLYCNGVETCDPTNDCQAGTPPNCDDGDACTIDACDESNDTCVRSDVACPDDGRVCNGTEYCDPTSGQCVSSGHSCPSGQICCEATGTCEDQCDAIPTVSVWGMIALTLLLLTGARLYYSRNGEVAVRS